MTRPGTHSLKRLRNYRPRNIPGGEWPAGPEGDSVPLTRATPEAAQ